MATVTTPHFVSSSCHGTSGSETKANLAQISRRNQVMTHNGLRSLNNLDATLRTRSPRNAVARQAGRKVGQIVCQQGISSKNAQDESSLGEVVCQQGMSIIFISVEVSPWSKTGGLGDVVGGLPPALAKFGHRVMTIAPRHDQYKDAWDTGVLVDIKVGGRIETVRFFHCYKRGVDRVFVDHPWFLEKVWGKTGSKIYGPEAGEDYRDNQLRFSLLCLAALEAPRVLSLNSGKCYSGPYGENVVFVANDWHTALLPSYLKAIYQPLGIYTSAKVVFCIHNIAYQGRFAFSDFSLLNLPDSFKSSFDFMDGYDKPVKGRKINWLKAAILECHRLVTVSRYYALELISGPAKGCELDNHIRQVCISGIENGMDTQEWDPATDKYLSVKYDITTVMEAKPILKEDLQAEVGLPVDRSIPVICFLGRLEEQKGPDILVAAVEQFIDENVQIIILGTGKKYLEKMIEDLEEKYPEKVRAIAKFNVPLAHMMIAGSDFIVVPSRFEPCGLIQLQAMQCGTVPCVASTGGLVDTVKEGYTGFHMGALNVDCEIIDPADVASVAKIVKRALATYGTPALEEMITNCMSQDLSWKGPAKVWEKLLLSLDVAGSGPGIEGEETAPLSKEKVPTP